MAPLDEMYLVWLYGQVANPHTRSQSRSYWNLCKALFKTEFEFFVPNDDARADDGIELRMEFIYDAEIPDFDPDWMEQGCSYLEMLIALSRRMAFITDGKPNKCFWTLIRNIGLYECNDTYTRNLEGLVEEVTNQITFRTYDYDGRGGLFPLRHPEMNQAEVELWFQMNAYVLEGGR